MTPIRLRAREYTAVETEGGVELDQDQKALLTRIAPATVDLESPAAREHLGLHLEQRSQQPRASCYVGQVWLRLGKNEGEPPVVLRVLPKVGAQPLRMYVDCVRHPIVQTHLSDCMTIWWDKPSIPIEESMAQISELVILRYLTVLYNLCQKHLRLMISPVDANLVGRIKGKPLVQATIRKNQARGRLDRVFCRFQVQSIDTVPNQIVAAALQQSIKYLQRSPFGRDQKLFHLAAFSQSALSGVTLRRILPADFQGLHYGGFLRLYREAHRLARLVLRMLGSDPLEEIRKSNCVIRLPPFAIDMNELFERFCEVGLRKVSDQEVWVGYKNRNLGSDFTVRPDFLVTVNKQAWIVDAKYKRDWSWKDKNYRTDIYQVVAYSRHKKVLQELLNLNPETGGRPGIVVLYPFDSEVGRNGFDPSHGLSVQHIFNNSEDRLNEFETQIIRAPIMLPGK